MRQIIIVAAALTSALTIFDIGALAKAQNYNQIYSFPGGMNGRRPYAGMVEIHGKLFGVTQSGGGSPNCDGGCGTVFWLNPKTGSTKTIYRFQGSDGANPTTNLVVIDGLLYGTAARGGPANAGTVFSIDPNTRLGKTIYAFTYAYEKSDDGSDPGSSLLEIAGKLYGTTIGGGKHNKGTVYSIDLSSGAEKVVYSFNETDGDQPLNGLVVVDNVLYGTTRFGGALYGGSVFAIDLVTGSETVSHSFGYENDGSNPESGLNTVGKKLYGTTTFGGTSDQGTIFEINPITGAEKVVHSFTYSDANPSDGWYPSNELLRVRGTLYGTTPYGGSGSCVRSEGCGTVFAFDLASQTEKVLYSFQDDGDGQHPALASLSEFQGTLYGTTPSGGLHKRGTIFSITP